MNKLMFNAWVKAQTVKQNAKAKAAAMKEAFLSEDGGAESIIIAIILIVIVVAVAIVFREQIGNWVNDLFTAGDDGINAAADGSTTATTV